MLPKIRRHFWNKSCLILRLSKNVFYKKCGPKLIYISMNFYFFERFGHLMTLNWLWMSRFLDFRSHCAISALQISKKHFAAFDSFVKLKLVSAVWVSSSLSKFGYWKSGHVCVELYHGQKNMDSDWNFLLNKVFSVLAFSSSLVKEVEAAILSAAA